MEGLNLLAQFVSSLSQLQEPWNYLTALAALLVLVITVGPQLINLGREVRDFHHGQRQLERQKERLEILKLQYEIEALRKTHRLTEPEALAAGPLVPVAKPRLKFIEPEPWKWLTRFPKIGKAFLFVLRTLFIVCAFFFGLTAIVVPFATLLGPAVELDKKLVTAMVILYSLLAWGFYSSYRTVKRWREKL